MPTTDPVLLRAMELSGNLLCVVTAGIIVVGLLMVALSFRKTEPK